MTATADTVECPALGTIEALAKQLKAHADEDVRRSKLKARPTARPYPPPPNASPDFWYLAPTTENPSYHQGKFIVTGEFSMGDALMGIWFEKGVGPSAALAFNSTAADRSQVLDAGRWIWPGFLAALADESFRASLDACQAQAGVRPTVAVLLGPCTPSGGGYRVESSHSIFYQYDAGALTHLVSEGPDEIMHGAESVADLPGLSASIKAADRYDWMWISVECGVIVNRVGGDAKMPRMGSDDLWNDVCGPFLDWFR